MFIAVEVYPVMGKLIAHWRRIDHLGQYRGMTPGILLEVDEYDSTPAILEALAHYLLDESGSIMTVSRETDPDA
jgi:hypothetical protein